MIVYDNMVFGLKLCKYDKVDIKKCVDNVVEIFGLIEYLKWKLVVLFGG